MKNEQLKIKVCGMKQPNNIQAVAALQPDYLGFIFYPKSPRNFEGEMPEISENIKKTGVFVDAEIDFILEKVKKYHFKAIQLHGSETATYCENLKQKLSLLSAEANKASEIVEVFKVFGIKDTFNFEVLEAYEPYVNYFLFDTKGKEKGGNGYAFDWGVLKAYKSTVPIILSGGIGPNDLLKVEQILKTNLPIYALDLNSKFEIEAGVKDTQLVEEFLDKVKQLAVKS